MNRHNGGESEDGFLEVVNGGGQMQLAQKVENILANLIGPLLSALARLLGVGNLPTLIKNGLTAVKNAATKPLRTVLDAVGKVFQAILNPILQTLGLTKQPVIKPETFLDNTGKSHHNWVEQKGTGNSVETYLASSKVPIKEQLDSWKNRSGKPASVTADVNDAITKNNQLKIGGTTLLAELRKAQKSKNAPKAIATLIKNVDSKQKALAMVLAKLLAYFAQHPLLGGKYLIVRKETMDAGKGGQVHHMPSCFSVSGCAQGNSKFENLPGIWMETADHWKTASYGSNNPAHRQAQLDYIQNQNNWQAAIQLDLTDLKKLNLDMKYKTGIDQYKMHIMAYPPQNVT